jgi:hypothetical protein
MQPEIWKKLLEDGSLTFVARQPHFVPGIIGQKRACARLCL